MKTSKSLCASGRIPYVLHHIILHVHLNWRSRYLAFRTQGIGLLFSPDPVPSDESISSSSRKFRQDMQDNKHANFAAVMDTASNKIVASSHWEFIPSPPTQDQRERLSTTKPPPPESNVEAWNDLVKHLTEQRIQRVLGAGQPVAFLHTLTTHPDHQRRGAGGKLLRFWLQEVDRRGVVAYLEASEAGKPLYARFGFKPVFEKEFDMKKYGGTGIDRNTVMIRPLVSSVSNAREEEM